MKSLLIVVSLLLFYNTKVMAEETIDPKALHTICAGANAIIATKMEPGIFADEIKSEAKRHAMLARELGATDSDLDQAIHAVGESYNQGKWSWLKITNLGESCSKL